MSTFRDTLKKLFTRNVVIKQLPGKRLKAYDVNKSQSQGSPTTYSNRPKWRTGRTFSAISGYGSGYSNEEIESLRRQMYIDYDLMDTDAIISSALDIYADEVTNNSVDGELLVIKTDNDEIKKILHNLFYDVLNINFNMWSWVRSMVKYGDMFLYLQINEEFGVVNVMPIHPSLMRREEGSDEHPDMVKFKYEGDFSFAGNEYFEAYEIAHFRMLADTNFLPYGVSTIACVRRIYKSVVLFEDAVLLHRIMRSPERRLFKIDIGNIAPEEVDSYMEQIIQETKKTPYIDPATGDYNLKYNLQNSMEDTYMPVRGGDSGTTIETLPGLEGGGQLEDLEYMKDKLFAGLKIPKEYMGYSDGGGSSKANLSQTDIRFARTIERMQKIFVSELYKIAIVHLYTQGFNTEDLMEFELMLTNPSLVFERQKTDVLVAKVDLATNIRENNLFPDQYIYENIFGLSEDVWKLNRERLIEDKKFALRLKQIEEEGNDPQETGRVLGTPYDIASMQVASKFNANVGQDTKKLYTPDERENNEGRPETTKSSFETRRDQDFGRDPMGRRDNEKMESRQPISKILKNIDLTFKRKSMKGSGILNEDQLFEDGEII